MDTSKKNICKACGTQYPLNSTTPELCPICDDDRQYIPENGQTWADFNELSGNYSVIAKKLNDNLYELKMAPSFAIGQRALLVLAPGGNILWDCIALLNEPIIEFIKSKGGLKAIAFSHPHYYSTMNYWAEVFNCPIYIHQNDEQWVFNKGNHVSLWTGIEKELWDGIRIINTGGHFPGSSILHIPFLSPKGAVLCGDTFAISPSKKHISAMYSYPNRIPLPLAEMERLKKQMDPISFDTMYGYADILNIYLNAKELFENSMAKYI
jgi:glyoxylase-like metal-dependent hydrolase (beta-lactamase superfamily II)